MELTKCKLGELITQRREKNDGSDLPICGVSKVDLILLLDEFGYPPVTIDDVYKEVLEQAENFKKYAN